MNKILIANRGEIARRIIRTCREMGIATVVVYSEPDADSLAVAEADEAVRLGGSAPSESYLCMDKIVEAAERTGADAVHPGYGFLAENASFARLCAEHQLTFIGPPPDVIASMGSKLEAKRQMEKAGVPVLPSVEVAGRTVEQLSGELDRLGLPILVKASAGGGGKGMRIVREASALGEAIEAAGREAKSAFDDDTLFLEPYVDAPRHVEFQIFGDTHGNLVHLFERECSIQRRHQKIIEETPSPAVDDALRAAMGDSAVRAAKAMGYVGAGTVEFLLTPEGKFYFLEVNTRLQVEHPVTECVTGLDLVRLQILVAQGEPLPREVQEASISGHAVEVRLYAEDPERDFMPVTGRLHRFQVPNAPGLRLESGVADGCEISTFYDPMLAKIIVHAPTRNEALRRLSAALAGSKIHGLRTNRELLVRVLRHEEFVAGNTDTHFLERHSPAELGVTLADPEAERIHAAAAALCGQARRRGETKILSTIPSGWRNNPSQLQDVSFEGDSGQIDVAYRWHRGSLTLKVGGDEVPNVCVGRCTPESIDLEINGVRRTFDVNFVGENCYIDSPLGSSAFREIDRFPPPVEIVESGSLVAPLPGVVVEIKVQPGDVVTAGDALIVIESMKMLHSVSAPVDGCVSEIRVEPSAQVDTGTVLAVIKEDES